MKEKSKSSKKGRASGSSGGKDEASFVPRKGPARLRRMYDEQILPRLMTDLGYRNKMAVPRIEKIVVNIGAGDALQNPKLLESALDEISVITGQKGVVTRARKSIAAFKLRQGQKIGCMVTLRRERMYEFFDRLISLALPRTRDFKGLSPRSFDGHGNYSFGIREQIVFPEIDYDKLQRIQGLNVTIATTARTDEEGRALLGSFGMPFRR